MSKERINGKELNDIIPYYKILLLNAVSLKDLCGHGSPHVPLRCASNPSLIFPILTSVRVRLDFWLFGYPSLSVIFPICVIFSMPSFSVFSLEILNLFLTVGFTVTSR